MYVRDNKMLSQVAQIRSDHARSDQTRSLYVQVTADPFHGSASSVQLFIVLIDRWKKWDLNTMPGADVCTSSMCITTSHHRCRSRAVPTHTLGGSYRSHRLDWLLIQVARGIVYRRSWMQERLLDLIIIAYLCVSFPPVCVSSVSG